LELVEELFRARLPSRPGSFAAICSLKVEYSLPMPSTTTKRVLPERVLTAFTFAI